MEREKVRSRYLLVRLLARSGASLNKLHFSSLQTQLDPTRLGSHEAAPKRGRPETAQTLAAGPQIDSSAPLDALLSPPRPETSQPSSDEHLALVGVYPLGPLGLGLALAGPTSG